MANNVENNDLIEDIAALQLEDAQNMVLAELIHNLDPHHDDMIFDFNELQLICYDDFNIIVRPCECHHHGLHTQNVSISSNMPSDCLNLVWQALELELLPQGVYFVCGWAANMFHDFSPIFFNREMVGLRGMLINVTPESKLRFLHTVCKLCDMGVTPCMYLRKMLVFATSATVVLHSEQWFFDVCELSVFWQELEYNRLYDL